MLQPAKLVAAQLATNYHSQPDEEAEPAIFQYFTSLYCVQAVCFVSTVVSRMISPKLKWATAAASLFLATFMTTGCHVQLSHPNQINAFDGAAYDTMVLAHGALLSLRAKVATDFPEYAPVFNGAIEAYNTAVVVYSTYRNSAGNESSVSTALGNLTVGITSLESALLHDLPVDGQHSAQIRRKAQKIRAQASAHLSAADIFTQLEIAASIAALVPTAGEYATLAKVILDATQGAITAVQAVADKPIQMSVIAAITPIP
jgi:hypothetical protein